MIEYSRTHKILTHDEMIRRLSDALRWTRAKVLVERQGISPADSRYTDKVRILYRAMLEASKPECLRKIA